MTAPGGAGPAGSDPALADALLALDLLAAGGARCGGIVLRGGGPVRDALVEALRAMLPPETPVRRLPHHIDRERLAGGVDLAASLGNGTLVRERGLLAEVAGGVLIVPMAERLPEALAGQLAQAMDGGDAPVLVLLDDGIEPDERPPATLCERVAFACDLAGVRGVISTIEDGAKTNPLALSLSKGAYPDCEPVSRTEKRPSTGSGLTEWEACPNPTAEQYRALAGTAMALGVDSDRALIFAARAAALSAASQGSQAVGEDDLAAAVRLVLAPRATRLPQVAPDEPEDDQPPPPEPPADSDSGDTDNAPLPDPETLEDLLLAAAAAAIPPGLFEALGAGRVQRASAGAAGSGRKRKAQLRGRPLGARPGVPRGGARLALIDTLRAAAPWQTLRRTDAAPARVQIRRDDLRIRRFEERAQALTIFAVDASGSSALARLAEAKGAVELMLAETYVKRAEVALIGFRKAGAELLLPPTRSLTRARRVLAELPGGGGTPLAAGIDAARELAEAMAARGRTPFVVLLTDGKANIARDGAPGRGQAMADAAAAARLFARGRTGAVVLDISPRPEPQAAELAAQLNARYLPLPRADAAAMHRAVRSVQQGALAA